MRNMTNKKRKPLFLIITLILFAFILFWIDLNTGYTPMSINDLLNLISSEASQSLKLSIVQFRLPRIIAAIFVGIGLSVSGCVLQGITQNELADPGVLGVNAGAALAVTLSITLFSKSLYDVSIVIQIASFLGALAAAMLAFALSYDRNTGLSSSRLVLTGVALAGALYAFTMVLLLRMRQSEYGFIASWLAGNIWGANWNNLKIIIPWISILAFFIFYKSNTLNILALGTQAAKGLGVSLTKQSLILLAAAVGLSSACVAIGGGISFIGLICPHLVRKLIGARHQYLLPAAALAGICIMLISDILGRTLVSPKEIPIGVVATVIAAPYFLYLLVNERSR